MQAKRFLEFLKKANFSKNHDIAITVKDGKMIANAMDVTKSRMAYIKMDTDIQDGEWAIDHLDRFINSIKKFKGEIEFITEPGHLTVKNGRKKYKAPLLLDSTLVTCKANNCFERRDMSVYFGDKKTFSYVTYIETTKNELKDAITTDAYKDHTTFIVTSDDVVLTSEDATGAIAENGIDCKVINTEYDIECHYKELNSLFDVLDDDVFIWMQSDIPIWFEEQGEDFTATYIIAPIILG
jgi:hypothetical protein